MEPTRQAALTYGDDQLQTLQRNTFRYVWQETNGENGLIPDNTAAGARFPVSDILVGGSMNSRRIFVGTMLGTAAFAAPAADQIIAAEPR